MKTQSCVFVAFRTDWPKRRRIAKLGAKAQVVVSVVAGAVIQMADLKINEDLAGQALRADQRYRPAPLVAGLEGGSTISPGPTDCARRAILRGSRSCAGRRPRASAWD